MGKNNRNPDLVCENKAGYMYVVPCYVVSDTGIHYLTMFS